MQELLFTLFIFFILFRVFRPKVHVHYYNSNKHTHYHQAPKPNGKITINKTPVNKGKEDSEFVEYEEIK